MKNTLTFLLLLTTCLALCLACSPHKKSETPLRTGTGGTGGAYYNYGKNLSAALAEKNGAALELRATTGSGANLRLMAAGYLDLAMVQYDSLLDAAAGEGPFLGQPLTGFHSVATLFDETCQFIVPADSDIKTIADLRGKRVSLGESDSGSYISALRILDAHGIAAKQLKIESNYSFSEAASALASGQIDAFFITAGAPTPTVLTLSENMPLRLLPIEPAAAENLILHYPAYEQNLVPAGAYAGQSEDVATLSVPAVLIASDELPQEIEAVVAGLIQDSGGELKKLSHGAVSSPEKKGVLQLSLNMYLTLALAVFVLYLGVLLRRRVIFLEKFCIPAPVVGGIVFALCSCALYERGVVEFVFDETLKQVCMIAFFTSVGFHANLKVLKQGGLSLFIFLACVLALIVCQNLIALGLARGLGISAFVGLCTGSIPMVGGHGTAGAFGQVLQDLGLDSAMTLCTAAATFGLVAGSLIGGPIGRKLILRHNLLQKAGAEQGEAALLSEEHQSVPIMYGPAAYQIALAMGLGTIVSTFLSQTGMTFPIYIGAMIVAACIRNLGEFSGRFSVPIYEINVIGGICLSLFLGIAMVTLKLWQLVDLALPLLVLLGAQVLFMAFFAYVVVFWCMGRDYDAAVLAAGICGFGLGATPNAMANMQVLTEKFAPSIKAYLLVPIVGSMFADFINSLVITLFINLI